jgi:hypothetical protein
MPNLDDANMENCEHEFSDLFREWDRVSQIALKQKALWHLEQDIHMIEDLKSGRGTSARLALWILEGSIALRRPGLHCPESLPK